VLRPLQIDEIHRLQAHHLESSTRRWSLPHRARHGDGFAARGYSLPIERFTLVGARTRTGQLGSPLLSRFGIVETFSFYTPDELDLDRPSLARLSPSPSDAGVRGARPPRARQRRASRPHCSSLLLDFA